MPEPFAASTSVPKQFQSQWLFPTSALLATPSATTSAISLSKELYDRERGVEFLFRLGTSLQLPTAALATAATWFHRFYMRFSMEDYHRQDVAAACIFLCTKTEECGRKLKDIAKVCQSKVTGISMEQISKEELEKCQRAILYAEEALLEALCFDFAVDCPHQILVDMYEKHQQEDNETVQEMAWCIAHDSYRTVLCILFHVRVISAACYILAQKMAEGPHSPSLDARILVPAPSTSLPTPPTHKPTSPPDAGRFAIEYLKLNSEELGDLADALSILIEFYSAHDLESCKYLLPLTGIQPPKTSPSRTRLYTPGSCAPSNTVKLHSQPTIVDTPENEGLEALDANQKPTGPAKVIS